MPCINIDNFLVTTKVRSPSQLITYPQISSDFRLWNLLFHPFPILFPIQKGPEYRGSSCAPWIVLRWRKPKGDRTQMEEIHQLVDGKHPIIQRVSTIPNWWCRISQTSTVWKITMLSMGRSTINGSFSIAMLVYQREIYIYIHIYIYIYISKVNCFILGHHLYSSHDGKIMENHGKNKLVYELYIYVFIYIYIQCGAPQL